MIQGFIRAESESSFHTSIVSLTANTILGNVGRKQQYSSATITRPPQGRPSFRETLKRQPQPTDICLSCGQHGYWRTDSEKDKYFDFYYNNSFRNSEIKDFNEYSKVKGRLKKNISFWETLGTNKIFYQMMKG